jgi:NitT/TauT family transport system substrate-binding protein
LILGLSFLAGCGGSEEATTDEDGKPLTKVVLQTDWYAQAEHGGFYQALVKGYYREAGLDVEIRQGGPNAMTMEKVTVGTAQFSLGRSDQIIVEASRGLPLQICGALMQLDPQGIMVHADSGIENFEDLDGKAIMAVPGSFFLDLLKKTYGIDFRVLPSDYGMDRFLANPDFIQQCFVTNEPYYVREAGADPKVLLISDSGFSPYRVWYARTDYVKMNPEIVKAFNEASIRGWQDYMTGDRTEANAMIQSLNAKMDEDFLAFSHSQLLEFELVTGPGGDWSQVGQVDPARLREQISQMEEIDALEGEVSVEGLFDPSLLPPAKVSASSLSEEEAGEGGEATRLPTLPTRGAVDDLELVARWEGAKAPTSRFVPFAALVSHPAVFEAAASLEFSDHEYAVRALRFEDLMASLPLAHEAKLVLAECNDKYQANFDARLLADGGAYLILQLDGATVQEWANNQGNPQWGPYLASMENFLDLLDPMHKQPWGVTRLVVRDEATMPWESEFAEREEVSVLALEGAKIYQGACLNCHAADTVVGGTMSTRPLPVLAAHAVYNRDYFERMLKDPAGTLPGAEKMPIMAHYGEAEIDRLVAFLQAAGL